MLRQLYLSAIFTFLQLSPAFSFGTYNSGGQTRLLGSSFGVPGNATFDFVV